MARYKDEAWLREQYHDKERIASDIGGECGVTQGTILYWMDKFGIDRRTRGAREGERNTFWRGGPETIVCENCGGDFEVARSRVENGTVRYCSWECRNDGLSERYSGEGNHQFGLRGEANPTYGKVGPEAPNWQGGSTWRTMEEWFDAREQTLNRDGWQCQLCGMENDEHVARYNHSLHVHHLTPVSDGGAKFELDNLQSICAECHSEQHNGKPFTQLRNESNSAE